MTVRRLLASARQFHENPHLIAFASTAIGRAAVWAVATLLLAPSSRVYGISPLLALVLSAPQWRVQILCIGWCGVSAAQVIRPTFLSALPTMQARLRFIMPSR